MPMKVDEYLNYRLYRYHSLILEPALELICRSLLRWCSYFMDSIDIVWWASDVETEPSEVLDLWVRRPAGPTVNPRR